MTCCCMLLYTKCHSSIRRSCQHDSGGPSHHAHGLCLHCLPNRQEMQIATDSNSMSPYPTRFDLVGSDFGHPYQYCNEETGHSHQYLDDRGCTSQGEFSTVCASTSKSGLCPSNVSGLRANHRQISGRNGCTGSPGSPGRLRKCAKAPRPPTWQLMLNAPDVKFHTVTQ